MKTELKCYETDINFESLNVISPLPDVKFKFIAQIPKVSLTSLITS